MKISIDLVRDVEVTLDLPTDHAPSYVSAVMLYGTIQVTDDDLKRWFESFMNKAEILLSDQRFSPRLKYHIFGLKGYGNQVFQFLPAEYEITNLDQLQQAPIPAFLTLAYVLPFTTATLENLGDSEFLREIKTFAKHCIQLLRKEFSEKDHKIAESLKPDWYLEIIREV